ncbi:hypothetical protein POM88_034727 [Heracleum sosnowskyi]|uniref:Uncharacterized protein n=1 Tax=Heracleum sosnowskyi TaxID=360622 RepID=A0AAD8HM30_9APIA|nr:hypothetical protein POM88_034727 [Heracleum sosnowskyi]
MINECLAVRTRGKGKKVELAAKDKENWNEWDIEARYIHQVQFLSEARQKLSSAQDELSTAKTKEEDERVKTLTAERDQFQEAHSDIEVGIVKLDAEKKEASVAFEAFNTAKEEFERISTHLLQLVKQKGVSVHRYFVISGFYVQEQLLLFFDYPKSKEEHSVEDTATVLLTQGKGNLKLRLHAQ